MWRRNEHCQHEHLHSMESYQHCCQLRLGSCEPILGSRRILCSVEEEEEEFFDAECDVVVSGEIKQEDNTPLVSVDKETLDNNQPRKINHSAGANLLKVMKATACMSLAAAAGSNGVSAQPEPISFHDAAEFTDDDILPEMPCFFDAEDYNSPQRPGKVMHLTLDYQTILKGEKRETGLFHQVC